MYVGRVFIKRFTPLYRHNYHGESFSILERCRNYYNLSSARIQRTYPPQHIDMDIEMDAIFASLEATTVL